MAESQMAEAFFAEKIWPKNRVFRIWPNTLIVRISIGRIAIGRISIDRILIDTAPPRNPLRTLARPFLNSACIFFIFLTIICIFQRNSAIQGIRPFKIFGHSDIPPLKLFGQLEFGHLFFGQLEFGHYHYYPKKYMPLAAPLM